MASGSQGRLGGRIPDSVLDDVLIAAGELVSNAVDRMSGDAALELAHLGDCVEVAVVDDGPIIEAVAAMPPARDKRGRGLAIVSAVACAWEVEATQHGKRVWARISGQ